jgi:hypothetical protein
MCLPPPPLERIVSFVGQKIISTDGILICEIEDISCQQILDITIM